MGLSYPHGRFIRGQEQLGWPGLIHLIYSFNQQTMTQLLVLGGRGESGKKGQDGKRGRIFDKKISPLLFIDSKQKFTQKKLGKRNLNK